MPAPRAVTPGLFVEGPEGPRLLAARCAACARPHFPAAPVCPYCGTEGARPWQAGPAARLKLFTAVSTTPPGYRGEVPYGFGVVELEGGLEVVTRLTETRLERLRPGLPMRLVLDRLCTDEDGTAVLTYAFAPEGP